MPIQTPSPIVIDDNPPIFLIDSSSEDDTPLKPRRRRASTPLENAYTDKTVSHILIPDYSLTPPDFSEDDPPHFRTPPEYDRVPGLREVKGEKNDPALLCENGDGPKLSYGYVTRYDAKFGTPRGNARAKRRRDTVKREARREGWVKEEDGEAGEWESFRPEDLVDVDPAEVKGERRMSELSVRQLDTPPKNERKRSCNLRAPIPATHRPDRSANLIRLDDSDSDDLVILQSRDARSTSTISDRWSERFSPLRDLGNGRGQLTPPPTEEKKRAGMGLFDRPPPQPIFPGLLRKEGAGSLASVGKANGGNTLRIDLLSSSPSLQPIFPGLVRKEGTDGSAGVGKMGADSTPRIDLSTESPSPQLESVSGRKTNMYSSSKMFSPPTIPSKPSLPLPPSRPISKFGHSAPTLSNPSWGTLSSPPITPSRPTQPSLFSSPPKLSSRPSFGPSSSTLPHPTWGNHPAPFSTPTLFTPSSSFKTNPAATLFSPSSPLNPNHLSSSSNVFSPPATYRPRPLPSSNGSLPSPPISSPATSSLLTPTTTPLKRPTSSLEQASSLLSPPAEGGGVVKKAKLSKEVPTVVLDEDEDEGEVEVLAVRKVAGEVEVEVMVQGTEIDWGEVGRRMRGEEVGEEAW